MTDELDLTPIKALWRTFDNLVAPPCPQPGTPEETPESLGEWSAAVARYCMTGYDLKNALVQNIPALIAEVERLREAVKRRDNELCGTTSHIEKLEHMLAEAHDHAFNASVERDEVIAEVERLRAEKQALRNTRAYCAYCGAPFCEELGEELSDD